MNRFNWNYPSQGMKTARTLEQAFGPYARGPVSEPDQPMPVADKIVVAASALAAVAIVIMAMLGWLK